MTEMFFVHSFRKTFLSKYGTMFCRILLKTTICLSVFIWKSTLVTVYQIDKTQTDCSTSREINGTLNLRSSKMFYTARHLLMVATTPLGVEFFGRGAGRGEIMRSMSPYWRSLRHFHGCCSKPLSLQNACLQTRTRIWSCTRALCNDKFTFAGVLPQRQIYGDNMNFACTKLAKNRFEVSKPRVAFSATILLRVLLPKTTTTTTTKRSAVLWLQTWFCRCKAASSLLGRKRKVGARCLFAAKCSHLRLQLCILRRNDFAAAVLESWQLPHQYRKLNRMV